MALPFATTLRAGVKHHRITAQTFRTGNPKLDMRVVNGMGARKSRDGARYNDPGVLTVCLADTPGTAFAERMFYLQREVVQSIDALHLPAGSLPPFSQTFVLWEIEMTNPVPDVLDLGTVPALTAHGFFPSLMLNPSQDYWHPKDRRAAIQSIGYRGSIAPSARSTTGGRMIVLFDDQSANVRRIVDHDATFELLQPGGAAFLSHTSDHLDLHKGMVTSPIPRAHGSGKLLPFHR